MVTAKDKLLAAAQKYLERGSFEKALAMLQAAAKEDPTDSRTWLRMAEMHVRLGENERALEAYQETVDLYVKQGFFQRAVAVYRNIIKLSPDFVEARLRLADVLRQCFLFSDAVEQLDQAATLFLKAGRVPDALAALRQIIDIDPEQPNPRIRYAELASQAGAREDAVAEFAEAARLLKAQGRTEDFLRVGERLLHHDRKNHAMAIELATKYLERKLARPALVHLKSLFEAMPRDVRVLDLLAQAFDHLGHPDRAMLVLKELARAYSDSGRISERDQTAKRVLAIAPHDAEMILLLGAPAGAQVPDPPSGSEQLLDWVLFPEDDVPPALTRHLVSPRLPSDVEWVSQHLSLRGDELRVSLTSDTVAIFTSNPLVNIRLGGFVVTWPHDKVPALGTLLNLKIVDVSDQILFYGKCKVVARHRDGCRLGMRVQDPTKHALAALREEVEHLSGKIGHRGSSAQSPTERPPEVVTSPPNLCAEPATPGATPDPTVMAACRPASCDRPAVPEMAPSTPDTAATGPGVVSRTEDQSEIRRILDEIAAFAEYGLIERVRERMRDLQERFATHTGGEIRKQEPANANPRGPDEYRLDAGAQRAADEMARHPSESSSRLVADILSMYPHVIARTFLQQRTLGPDDWQGAIPRWAYVLDATLQHLALVAMAEYLAEPARRAGADETIRSALSRPSAFGTHKEILDELLPTLTPSSPNPRRVFLADVQASYPAVAKQSDLRHLLNNLIHQRNVLLKKDRAVSPTRPDHDEFKRQLLGLLGTLAFLGKQQLVWPRSCRTESDTHIYDCLLLNGADDIFLPIDVETELRLETGHVFLLDDLTRMVLDLHPLLVVDMCPSCHKNHLFLPRFFDGQKGRLAFEAPAEPGHTLELAPTRERALGEELAELLENVAPPGRLRKAEYLLTEGGPEAAPLIPGELVGPYEVVRHIRKGGMADVYEVCKPSEDSHFALKLLRMNEGGTTDRRLLSRFRKETRRLSKLEHENVVAIKGQQVDSGGCRYIVMELATGWPIGNGQRALDLGELPKPVDEGTVLHIARQIAAALVFLHSQRFIHRDIKPGNVLLFEGNRVKLGDFGIARPIHSGSDTTVGLTLGTPEYMSPEQSRLRGDQLTVATDIYSLGIVLYELLCGQRPFAETGRGVISSWSRGPVVPIETRISRISPALAQIVNRCLESDPDARFQSATDLAVAIEAAISLPR